MNNRILSIAALASCVVCVACGKPANERACEIAVDGPSNAVTASVDADATAGDVSEKATRHDITLVAVTDGNGGNVRINSEGGEQILYLNTAVDPVVTATGIVDPILPVSTQDETTCPEVTRSATYSLPAGESFIALAEPIAETSYFLIVLAASEDDDDDDDLDSD